MKLDKSMNILIVGLGLMGGSYAMALKKKGYKVKAITRRQSSIDYALEHGLIDAGTTENSPELISEADIVVCALYPHIFIDWAARYGKYIREDALFTDVTGVKSCVVEEIAAIPDIKAEFVAAHPMAGREVYGVESSSDKIFHGANYIVVPTPGNSPGMIELCESLGHTLGFAKISRLTPAEHDEMIAFLSQLTHCIAVALMCCNESPNLEKYTGDSFRDLIRIARINDAMWSELFLLNRDALIRETDSFIATLTKLRDAISDGDSDTIREMMRHSTERRALFDKKI